MLYDCYARSNTFFVRIMNILYVWLLSSFGFFVVSLSVRRYLMHNMIYMLRRNFVAGNPKHVKKDKRKTRTHYAKA